MVADLRVANLAPDLEDDARRIGAADVEGLWLARLLPRLDDVDRGTERGPDVVVVDACRHHVDQHLVRRHLGHVDRLDLECLGGDAEPVLADDLRNHPLRHLTDRQHLPDLVNVLHEGPPDSENADL